MKKILNYHHHTTFSKRNNSYYIISLHGVFLNELSNHFDTINLFLYENPNINSTYEDYKIENPKLKIHSLGKKKNLIYRTLFANHYAKKILKTECSKILVRSPSPLLPTIIKLAPNKVVPLIVGDYIENLKVINGNFIKRNLIILWYKYYQMRYVKSLRKINLCLFNNPYLQEKYSEITNKSELVSTSLVSKTNFSSLPIKNLSQNKKINFLYVGRIDLAKGIKEFILAIPSIKKRIKQNIVFTIVGWDDSQNEIVKNSLINLTKELEIENNVVFFGKVNHGEELFKIYQNSDIFYIGSKSTEGFPRTIWEAMSSKLIVLCNPVGGIPFYIDESSTFFLETLDTEGITNKVELILSDDNSTKLKINNAFELVQNYTIENSVKIIANHINEKY